MIFYCNHKTFRNESIARHSSFPVDRAKGFFVSYDMQPQYEVATGLPGGMAPELGLSCPFCGGIHLYKLGDGRRKCRDCRRRFTPNRMASRLDDNVLDKLCGLFWDLVPAEEASAALGLNRKTVQRYYRKMRQAIAEHKPDTVGSDQQTWQIVGFFHGYWRRGGLSNDLTGVFPVFGLACMDGSVRVIMAHNKADYSRLDAHSLCMAALQKPNGDQDRLGRRLADEFWAYARPRLGTYHGGWKANLPLFLQEMEFRFNHRNYSAPPNLLRQAI